MDSDHDVIDAFIDGERVDTGGLRRALTDTAGLDYFLDTWMLREAVQQDPDMIGTERRQAVLPPRRTTRQARTTLARRPDDCCGRPPRSALLSDSPSD